MKGTVESHLSSILGPTPELVAQVGDLRVLAWADAANPELATLATVGMSFRAQVVGPGLACPSKEPRTELVSVVRAAEAHVLAEIMADLAGYPFAKARHLFWWHTLPVGRPVKPESPLDAVLISRPDWLSDGVTFQAGGFRVDLLWVIPISSGELALARLHGVERLERALAEEDVADLGRVPVA